MTTGDQIILRPENGSSSVFAGRLFGDREITGFEGIVLSVEDGMSVRAEVHGAYLSRREAERLAAWIATAVRADPGTDVRVDEYEGILGLQIKIAMCQVLAARDVDDLASIYAEQVRESLRRAFIEARSKAAGG